MFLLQCKHLSHASLRTTLYLQQGKKSAPAAAKPAEKKATTEQAAPAPAPAPQGEGTTTTTPAGETVNVEQPKQEGMYTCVTWVVRDGSVRANPAPERASP